MCNKTDSTPCHRLEVGVSRTKSISNKRKAEVDDLSGTPPSTKCMIGYPVNEENPSPYFYTFMLISFGALKSIIGQAGICPVCSQPIDNEEIQNECIGFCSTVRLFCRQCDWTISNFLSEEIETEKGSRGRKLFEVNLRAVLAFRQMGKGHEGFAICRFVNGRCHFYRSLPPTLA